MRETLAFGGTPGTGVNRWRQVRLPAPAARASPGGAGGRDGARRLADDGHAVGGLAEDAGAGGHRVLLEEAEAALARGAGAVAVDGGGGGVLQAG